MKAFFEKLGRELYERVIVSHKSTLISWALAMAVIAVDQVMQQVANWHSPYAVHVAVLIGLVGSMLKNKAKVAELAAVKEQAEQPKGITLLPLLAILAVLSLGLAACAALRGASAATTVTTQDGKSYTLTVGDAGGCVVGAGWYAIPKTPFECSKVCVDVNPGAVTPGAVCRLVGRPETEFEVQIPVPTKAGG